MCKGTTTVSVAATASTSAASATTVSAASSTCPVAESVLQELKESQSKGKAKENAVIALAVLFGCTAIAFGAMAIFWSRERRQLKDRLQKAETADAAIPTPDTVVRARKEEMQRLKAQSSGA